ncbi:MAG: hypothetical protein K6A95_01445 [Bacteroidales bacterium]|nr:hypothetical protein [Bacteroidales bacterium]
MDQLVEKSQALLPVTATVTAFTSISQAEYPAPAATWGQALPYLILRFFSFINTF